APPFHRGDPVGPPGRVDRLAPGGEQAQADFRRGGVQRLAEMPAATIADGHDAWRIARLVVEIRAIDPGMPWLPARGALRPHDDGAARDPTGRPSDRPTVRHCFLSGRS